MPSPLNTRQILVVNLITDALPALAVVLQQSKPAYFNSCRSLSTLNRSRSWMALV